MAIIAILIVLVAIILFFSNYKKEPPKAKRKGANRPILPETEEERILAQNREWLEERWEIAKNEKESGTLKSVPGWFFDPATDRQVEKLGEAGIKIKEGNLTKGMASDMIGLFEPPEEDSQEILKFFKFPMKEMNQSRARHEVAKLLANPDNEKNWRSRPASSMQKEFYRFFGIKIPQGLMFEDAKSYIDEFQKQLFKDNNVDKLDKLDDWNNYSAIYDEINDPDYRDDREIKKVSLPIYRAAIEQLLKEDVLLQNIYEDVELVIDKIIEMKPDIEITKS